MNIDSYDYVEPEGVSGKIILTCFPGRKDNAISFNDQLFLDELKFFYQLNCSAIVSLVEDSEFEKMYDKKYFLYKDDGLRAIRALSEMIFSISMVITFSL